MTDRDMYYNGYSYGGYTPLNNMPNQQFPPMMNNQPFNEMENNSFKTTQFNDINERINRLERQVKRLDQRLNRLETPYINGNNFNQEPDNNMYMM